MDIYHLPICSPSSVAEATIYRSEPGAAVSSTGIVGTGANSLDMLSVAVKIDIDDRTHLKVYNINFFVI